MPSLPFQTVRPPVCRWCDQEPEFAPTAADFAVCTRCGAMQSPVMRMQAPTARIILKFWVNPDDSVFFELEKLSGDTTRYILSPALLAAAGAMMRAPIALNGVKIDRIVR